MFNVTLAPTFNNNITSCDHFVKLSLEYLVLTEIGVKNITQETYILEK